MNPWVDSRAGPAALAKRRQVSGQHRSVSAVTRPVQARWSRRCQQTGPRWRRALSFLPQVERYDQAGTAAGTIPAKGSTGTPTNFRNQYVPAGKIAATPAFQRSRAARYAARNDLFL